MKTARAPLRISFAGGGTDVDPYCSEHGGMVISAAINMYATAVIDPKHTQNKLEETLKNHYQNMNAACLKITSDVPPKSGLGGSAACFAAGIKLMAPGSQSKNLADLAFHLERDKMGILGGRQDQYAASFGGLNYMTFRDAVDVFPLSIPNGFEDCLTLIYLGARENDGPDIIADQNAHNNVDNFHIQKEIVSQMKRALQDNDLVYFGGLVNVAWHSKLRFSPLIASPTIKDFARMLVQNGALGAKLTGAGGGGYMLAFCDPGQPGRLEWWLEKKGLKYLKPKIDREGAKCL
jgi:D-glycero-alpha-D-manno-heptose-7-phosphate kinase